MRATAATTQNDRSDKLVLTKTGGGGLPELTDALDDSKASYAYVRVKFAKDKESTRERFVFVKWIGKGCKIMRKAKVRSLPFSLFLSFPFTPFALPFFHKK